MRPNNNKQDNTNQMPPNSQHTQQPSWQEMRSKRGSRRDETTEGHTIRNDRFGEKENP